MLRVTVVTGLEDVGMVDTAMLAAGVAMVEDNQGVPISAMGAMIFNLIGMSHRHQTVNQCGMEMVHTILFRISTHGPLGPIRVTAIPERDRRQAFITSSRFTSPLGSVVESGLIFDCHSIFTMLSGSCEYVLSTTCG